MRTKVTEVSPLFLSEVEEGIICQEFTLVPWGDDSTVGVGNIKIIVQSDRKNPFFMKLWDAYLSLHNVFINIYVEGH